MTETKHSLFANGRAIGCNCGERAPNLLLETLEATKAAYEKWFAAHLARLTETDPVEADEEEPVCGESFDHDLVKTYDGSDPDCWVGTCKNCGAELWGYR